MDLLHRLRFLLKLLPDLYTLGLLVWFTLWRLLGDVNGWLALVNAWAFWLLAVGVPAGVTSLARRSWWLAVIWLVASGTFFLKFCHRQMRGLLRLSPALARPGSGADGGTPAPRHQLVLYSANLLNHPRSLDLAIEQVLAHQADVLLFQECIDSHVPQLEPMLADYPHRCWIPYLPTNLGLGVASRLPFALTGFWQNSGLEPYALRITVALPAGPLDLYCVHFISPTHQLRKWGPTRLLRTREQQVLNVLAAVEARDYPAVLAGDWNATEASDSYRWVSDRLVDGWLQANSGPGWSWPRFWDAAARYPMWPLLRLDYLFHTGQRRDRAVGVEAMQCIMASTTSDHCPIVARLSI